MNLLLSLPNTITTMTICRIDSSLISYIFPTLSHQTIHSLTHSLSHSPSRVTSRQPVEDGRGVHGVVGVFVDDMGVESEHLIHQDLEDVTDELVRRPVTGLYGDGQTLAIIEHITPGLHH